MKDGAREPLGLVAGRGVYPLQWALSARKQGAGPLFAVAFRGETRRDIVRHVDRVVWLPLGSLDALLSALRSGGVRRVVMAGQITPRHLFHLRIDRSMRALLRSLPSRNADTIFGAVCARIRDSGIEILPASIYMQDAMPSPGVMGRRAPDERERRDINLGWEIAKTLSGLHVGQTVAVKEGAVLAVEAFEGTDQAIRRAGRVGGRGAVIVKVARRGHDMRFDIPIVGLQTVRVARKAGVAAMALEAGRTILLEREALVAAANRHGLALLALDGPLPVGCKGRDPAEQKEDP